MIEIGKINSRRVIRSSDIGLFLEGDENWDDFLLPKKYVTEDMKVGGLVEVAVYFDSEGRIIGSTNTPLAQVGEFASLKVTSVAEIGTFLDWGLSKDLFVPHREQLYKMEVGESYPVYVYLDNSGRPAASTRINKYVDKTRPPYEIGDEVDLLIYQDTDLGLKALINRQYAGVIYQDDILNNLELGQTTRGYIKLIRSDHKIDLSLRPMSGEIPLDLKVQILTRLQENGGVLPISSKSSAELVNQMFGVSRKKFKIALGALYKQKKIEIDDDSIRLTS